MKLELHKSLLPTIFILILLIIFYGNSEINAESNDDIGLLLSRINRLEAEIETLSNKVESNHKKEAFGPFRNPDFDSNWIPIEPGKSYTFYHGQGVNPFVYILGWDDEGINGYTIHQSGNGVNFWSAGNSTSNGIMWCCSNIDEISIKRDLG